MKAGKKHVFICLLLCSLFLSSYFTVLNTNGIISFETNVYDVSFGSGGSGHSSMDSVTNFGHSYLPNIGAPVELFNIFSIKNTQSLIIKVIFGTLTALIAAQIIGLIYSSKLSRNICTHFNSIRIVFFLHQKDGMK